MKVMSYSMDLERRASAWVATCPNGHNPNHQDAAGNYVGENIYYSWNSNQDTTLKASVGKSSANAWYSEVNLFSSQDINPFSFSFSTGHYTQVVWADTTEVGCGVALCLDSSP
jgi:hypothetical protein